MDSAEATTPQDTPLVEEDLEGDSEELDLAEAEALEEELDLDLAEEQDTGLAEALEQAFGKMKALPNQSH